MRPLRITRAFCAAVVVEVSKIHDCARCEFLRKKLHEIGLSVLDLAEYSLRHMIELPAGSLENTPVACRVPSMGSESLRASLSLFMYGYLLNYYDANLTVQYKTAAPATVITPVNNPGCLW